MIKLRLATLADLPEVYPRTRALNDHEGITISNERLTAGLEKLLGNPGLGAVFLVTRDGETIGYTIITYGFDLEFGGRDAYMTELWIDADQRSRGAGTEVLAALEHELRLRDVNAVHLQVRPENPAVHLYERTGWVTSPRRVMTRTLV